MFHKINIEFSTAYHALTSSKLYSNLGFSPVPRSYKVRISNYHLPLSYQIFVV